LRIIESSRVEKKVASLTIEADKGEDLSAFEAALNSHQWVRQKDGKLETAPAHRNPPILFDKDIDPIWNGKSVKVRPLRLPEEKPSEYRQRSFYIQHIAGYSGGKEKKAQRLILSGFEVLRSRRSLRDGKCWEVWYLPGAWAAEGELDGRSEEKIKQWILDVIRPGTLELAGESWGLSIE